LFCQDQHLWAALIETLTFKLFRDPLPNENLRTLSTGALVGLAKRAARGPEMWVDPCPASAPIFVRELRVPCPSVQRANFFSGRAELLPGGRYVLVTHRAAVMLLDAANAGEVLGTHSTQAGAHIHGFRSEIVPGGDWVVVMLHTELFGAPRKKWVIYFLILKGTGLIYLY
jgi:hypothetical protein